MKWTATSNPTWNLLTEDRNEKLTLLTPVEIKRCTSFKSPGSPEWKAQRTVRRQMPSILLKDPGFKRLYYVPYADDFLMGVTGSKEDAMRLLRNLKSWLDP